MVDLLFQVVALGFWFVFVSFSFDSGTLAIGHMDSHGFTV
jgi:hypothetical protein